MVKDWESGKYEPSALLPIQLPASMAAVEHQLEDNAHNMEEHVDAAGNALDFTFGLNLSGGIQAERVRKYKRKYFGYLSLEFVGEILIFIQFKIQVVLSLE